MNINIKTIDTTNMWHLFFLFSTIMNILSFIYPFLVKFELKLNVLRLKGEFTFKIFNKLKFTFRFRIKHGYIYFYYKSKEWKEKIEQKNVNLIFIKQMINQAYFRQQMLNLGLNSNFGFNLDSCVTAVGCGFIDVITKCIFSKIKNNKKSAHIFVFVEPKYNEDIFNVKLTNEIRMSIFDMLYALIYARIYTWREHERYGKETG